MEENARDIKIPTRRSIPPPSSAPEVEREDTLKVPTSEGVIGGAKPLDIPNSPSMRSWGGTAQAPHHRATSFNAEQRLSDRRQQQDQDISHQLLEDDVDSVRRHSSSLGSLEGIPPSDNSSFHRRKSSNERGRGGSIRGGGSSSRTQTSKGSLDEQTGSSTIGQGSLREKFCSTFAGGEEGDEGEELLFAMSDMMGDKR